MGGRLPRCGAQMLGAVMAAALRSPAESNQAKAPLNCCSPEWKIVDREIPSPSRFGIRQSRRHQ